MDAFLAKLPVFIRIWLFEYIKKFATVQGRANRAQYWYSYASVIIVTLLLSILSAIPFLGLIFALVSFLFSLAIIIPGITITARRLHDIGLSALWIIWYGIAAFVAMILSYVVIILGGVMQSVGTVYFGIFLLVVVLIAAAVVWIFFMAKKGDEGANKFGEAPVLQSLDTFSKAQVAPAQQAPATQEQSSNQDQQ